MTIFELLTEYHQSLDRMKSRLEASDLDPLDRIGIADAWQDEMRARFEGHGFCFACNRMLGRCCCGRAA